MATSIANLNVKISGDARGFNAAAAGAMRTMKAINAQARSVTGLSSAFKAVGAQQTMLGKATMAGAIVGVRAVKNYQAAVSMAGKSVKGLASISRNAFRVIATAAAAAAGAIAVFRAGFNDIDAVSDMAKRLGVTTEALSNLQFAANRADVDVEALNAGLGKMLVNVQKAASGSGEAAKALADVGVTAEELKSMSPDAAFAKIADGIRAIEDPYKQAAAAQAIFGKGGLQLLPMLREGSEWLAAMGDAAAATGKQVTALEASRIDAVDEAFKNAKDGIAGLAQTVAVELSPYITDLTQRFTEFITESGGLRSKIAPAIDILLKGVGFLTDGFYAIKSVVAFIRSGILKMAEVAVGAFSGLLKGINATIEGVNKLSEWTGLGLEIGTIDTSGIDRIKDALGEVSSEFLDEGLKNFDKTISGAGSEAIDNWRKGIDAAQKQADAAAQGNSGMFGAVANAVGAIKFPPIITEGIDDAEMAVDKFSEAMEGIKAEIDSINKTPIDIKIADLTREFPDIAANQIEEYRRALETLDLQQLGANLREQLVTPVDEAQRQFDDIRRAFEGGVITAEEQAQLLENLKGDLGDAKEGFVGPSDQFASAATNKAESNRLDQLFRNQQSRTSNRDKSEKQLKEAEKQSRLLASIDSAIAGGIVQVTEISI